MGYTFHKMDGELYCSIEDRIILVENEISSFTDTFMGTDSGSNATKRRVLARIRVDASKEFVVELVETGYPYGVIETLPASKVAQLRNDSLPLVRKWLNGAQEIEVIWLSYTRELSEEPIGLRAFKTFQSAAHDAAREAGHEREPHQQCTVRGIILDA